MKPYETLLIMKREMIEKYLNKKISILMTVEFYVYFGTSFDQWFFQKIINFNKLTLIYHYEVFIIFCCNFIHKVYYSFNKTYFFIQ